MAKKKKRGGGATPSGAKPVPSAGTGGRMLDNALLLLCAAGIALTTYLTYTAWFVEHPLFCDEGSGCDLVQASRWSTLAGMPMSFWGLLTYLVLARLVWRRRTKASAWRWALFVAVIGVAISLYLTVVSIFSIGATCPFCLTSFAFISAILALVLLRKPPDPHQFPWASSINMPLVAAFAIVVGLHMHFSGLFDAGAGPEKPALKGLALHLERTGAEFYGAKWCPRCIEQKELFEASAHRLPYVECSPYGRGGPVSTVCIENEIKDYPTWIIRGKRQPGRLTPRELALFSLFPIPEGGF